MTIETLREKNPGLRIYSVTDPEFAPYGRVLEMDTSGLREAMLNAPLPETGNVYVADDEAVHALPMIGELQKTVFGGMAVEAGYCNGHSFKLNALEYHKCSEVNYSPTGCVLLMALPSDIQPDRHLDSESVVAFWLPPEVLIEVHPLVLHFAPCRTEENGFRCLVVLTEGTNTPVDNINTSLAGENGLLWMRNKWLIAHPESVPAGKGAFVGIDGENTELKI